MEFCHIDNMAPIVAMMGQSDRDDPTVIVQRSEDALLRPELPWETCSKEGKGRVCQEPMVVFSTGQCEVR